MQVQNSLDAIEKRNRNDGWLGYGISQNPES
jgi:hypothetical protein